MVSDIQITRRRWLLLTPALTILTLAAAGPLLIVLLYSFLTAGDYGGVVCEFSIDAWFDVIAERDFFDDTLSFSDAHLSIFWRSVRLSLVTTLVAFLVGFPTGMPHLKWSTVMFRKRRTENGEQAAQARGNSSEAAAG